MSCQVGRVTILFVALSWLPHAAEARTIVISRPPANDELSTEQLLSVLDGAFGCILTRSSRDPARDIQDSKKPAVFATSIAGAVGQDTPQLLRIGGRDCADKRAARDESLWLVVDFPTLLPFSCSVQKPIGASCSVLPAAPKDVADSIIGARNRLEFIASSLSENSGLSEMSRCPDSGCSAFHYDLRRVLAPAGPAVVPKLRGLLGDSIPERELWTAVLQARSAGEVEISRQQMDAMSPMALGCPNGRGVLKYESTSVSLVCEVQQLETWAVDLRRSGTRVMLPKECAGVQYRIDNVDSVRLFEGRRGVMGPVSYAYGNNYVVDILGSNKSCAPAAKGFTTVSDLSLESYPVEVKVEGDNLPVGVVCNVKRLRESLSVRVTRYWSPASSLIALAVEPLGPDIVPFELQPAPGGACQSDIDHPRRIVCQGQQTEDAWVDGIVVSVPICGVQ